MIKFFNIFLVVSIMHNIIFALLSVATLLYTFLDILGEAWAAVIAKDGATLRISEVAGSGCTNYNSYVSSNALTVVWDQGRNTASDMYVMKAIGLALIPVVTQRITATLLATISSTNLQSCITNNAVRFLSAPASAEIINLTPTDVAPVGGNFLTVGNILVAVFSYLVVV